MRKAIWSLPLVMLPLAAAFADRGMILIGKPTVSLSEPAQKAIVAWNKGTEIIILSTDTRAPKEGKALGIIPLPSIPKVEKGSTKAFLAVERLIWQHAPRLFPLVPGAKARSLPPEEGVRVVFRKKIGAHNLTAVEAKDIEAFVKWAERFARKHVRTGLGRLPQQWKEIVGDYIRRGIRFFVFDLVEVGKETKSVEPLVYIFKSPRPFYPLKISSPMEGLTTVQVFLFTPQMPDIFSLDSPLWVATYRTGPNGWKPIMFPVSRSELSQVDKRLSSLFGNGRAYFCAFEYRGPISGLFADLEIRSFLKTVALSPKIRRRGHFLPEGG